MYDEHADITVDIRNMMIEFEEILGEMKKKHWDKVIADQSREVKTNTKKIRTRAKQIAPRSAISSYEREMLQVQKDTAKAQRKLVVLELMKQDRESKEGKALVSSKALEFKENVKALGDHIKLLETRNDPDLWKNTEAETITRALKDQNL